MSRHFLPVLLISSFLLTSASFAVDAKQSVADSGVKGGLMVHLGCGDGTLTAALRVNDGYLVHGLDADVANVEKARANILAAGLYGSVSISRQTDKTHLPYCDNLVNLLVADNLNGMPMTEVMRVLVPNGVALIGGRKTVKPWPKEIDEWTHYLHEPNNNAVAQDSVTGEPRSLQWSSPPRWGRSHEEAASLSSTVTAGGRIFSIVDQAPYATIRFLGQWELVAQDAFNGIELWKKPIPVWSDHLRHFRAGPAHLPRRLVAVGDTVYVTLGLAAPVTALDAATGEVRHVYKGTERTEEILVADGVLYLAVGTSEIVRKGGGFYERGEPKASSFRFIAAVRADSGSMMWKKDFTREEQLLPLSLTVSGKYVCYQSASGVGCLDAASGKEVWKTPRKTIAKRMSFSAPTVVAASNVLLVADRTPAGKDAASNGLLAWGVHGWNEPGFARKGKSTLTAYAIDTGKELWSTGCSEGYNSPTDVFVIGNTVWVGSDFKGYDLKTGAAKGSLKWKGAKVAMPHHRCYRDKASTKYIFTGRSGVEMVDLEKGWIGNNSWIRGTCQYGVMPANGFVYAPPNACACYAKVKIQGFVAAATQREKSAAMVFSDAPALEKGPLYGKVQLAEPATAEDWPMYRRNGVRSGFAQTSLPATPRKKWSVTTCGRALQPLCVGERLYVASPETDTVQALNAADGKRVWQYIASGRIDSSPTYYKGLLLLGTADGYVTCLRASDGGVVWRFRVAPKERWVCSFGRLESAWPVHGSVLVQHDKICVTAGRNTYLDGGIVFYQLDPLTGKQLARNVTCNLDPKTGRQTGAEPLGGFNMEGVGSDILVGNGNAVFMRHAQFDETGKRIKEEKPHLFCMTGLLNEEWFVRTYWILGTNTSTGWGGWANAGKSAPFGRILSFEKNRVWGYGRKTIASGPTGHKADAYHLFCKEKTGTASNKPAAPAPKKGKKKRGRGKGGPAPKEIWSVEKSPIVRAMVLTSDKLIIAGPPDMGKKDPKLLGYLNESEARAAFDGAKGVLLQVVNAADGKTLSEQKLKCMPVFDGMSAAHGNLYVALKDGTLECWGKD